MASGWWSPCCLLPKSTISSLIMLTFSAGSGSPGSSPPGGRPSFRLSHHCGGWVTQQIHHQWTPRWHGLAVGGVQGIQQDGSRVEIWEGRGVWSDPLWIHLLWEDTESCLTQWHHSICHSAVVDSRSVVPGTVTVLHPFIYQIPVFILCLLLFSLFCFFCFVFFPAYFHVYSLQSRVIPCRKQNGWTGETTVCALHFLNLLLYVINMPSCHWWQGDWALIVYLSDKTTWNPYTQLLRLEMSQTQIWDRSDNLTFLVRLNTSAVFPVTVINKLSWRLLIDRLDIFFKLYLSFR